MKTIVTIFAIVLAASGLSSCAFHNGLTSNVNQHATQVVLSRNNYKIVQKIQGSASSLYVLGFGGSYKSLIAEARSKMLDKAGFIGTTRAVINETIEINKEFCLMTYSRKVTVSAYVVEFTD
ncbi:MAG: hypothetical protein LBF09_07360 [Odoribacteraceae bacterium]|jgi:hypothetical protein|nr:hypothetical protein [Odoribacteraceae bacterium]